MKKDNAKKRTHSKKCSFIRIAYRASNRWKIQHCMNFGFEMLTLTHRIFQNWLLVISSSSQTLREWKFRANEIWAHFVGEDWQYENVIDKLNDFKNHSIALLRNYSIENKFNYIKKNCELAYELFSPTVTYLSSDIGIFLISRKLTITFMFS